MFRGNGRFLQVAKAVGGSVGKGGKEWKPEIVRVFDNATVLKREKVDQNQRNARKSNFCPTFRLYLENLYYV